MIANGLRSAVLYALRPHKVVLGDVLPQGLVAPSGGDTPPGPAPS